MPEISKQGFSSRESNNVCLKIMRTASLINWLLCQNAPSLRDVLLTSLMSEVARSAPQQGRKASSFGAAGP